ncbi:hypothetical protein BKA62DRAFT_228461 [Auriculariales sp. MPI-PUGE-AT-0066]|nr:hypothetical protein BKA62DRAFT_228461 [Auriculariales sp. MPI-PUGE-AT-0066]
MDKATYIDSSFGYDSFADQFLSYAGTSPYGIPLSQAQSPPLAFSQLNLSSNSDSFSAFNNGYGTTSPPPTPPGHNQRPFTPVDLAVSPHVTTALHSEDGFTSSGSKSHSERSVSPKSSQLVQRTARRGSVASVTRPSSKAMRRRKDTDDFDSDDDNNDIDYSPGGLDGDDRPKAGGAKRKDEVRRQRIESEQRRRDELREGYRKLKEVLPASNQKASKVSLLDRATMHIRYLEITQQQLQARVQQAELETQRLRLVNEKMMLATAEHNQQALAAAAAQASMGQY